jgi:hypothetical protein
MEFGTIMDLAYDEYYRTRSLQAACEVIDRAWQGDVLEEPGRTKDRALKTMKMYVDRWQDDGVEVLVASHREVQSIPIPGTDYQFTFKLDKIIKWDNAHYVYEGKITSQLTGNTLNRYNPNLQLKLYVWAARRMGLPVSDKIVGALIDVTCVAVSKIDFKRDIFTQTEHDDLEVLSLLHDIINDIEERSDGNHFRPTWAACSRFGECYFRRACKQSPHIRDLILDADYPKEEEHG